MNNEKHEFFHSWLRWKKEKSGRYPSIKKQKRILVDEYGGSLVENLRSPEKTNKKNFAKDLLDERKKLQPHLQNKLMEQLKAVRSTLASENGVRLYMIFNNKTLIEMSEKLPTCETEMLAIKGVGPAKFEKYGGYFIQKIKSFKENQKEDSA